MRRILFALVLTCVLGLPIAAARADDTATGPVAFTVHAALCPLDVVNDPNVGLYDGCHHNGIEGITFTFSSLEGSPVAFVSDADGVAVGSILDGVSSVTQVTLAASDPTAGYAYCSDQNSGDVLYNGTKFEEGAVPLFTVSASQDIVCDWYVFADEVAAG